MMRKIGFFLLFITLYVNLSTAKDIFKDLEEACNKGDAISCQNLGLVIYITTEVQGADENRNYKKAAYFFKKACDLGEISGCTRLGNMYERGKGVGKDLKKALQLYEKACNLGGLSNCITLASKYKNGSDLKKNLKKAAQLYEKACNSKFGVGIGCFELGQMYRRGEGVEKNLKKAAQLFKKACDLKNGLGCFNLGYLYLNGEGIKKNLSKAAQFFRKACDLDEALGCYGLGIAYEYGSGVKENFKKAVQLYKKACNLGYKKACEYAINLKTVKVNKNPKPLGLEIGKATIEEAKRKYSLKFVGINAYTKGEMYEIPEKEIPIDGVISNTLIFDKNGILQALLLIFPKEFEKTYWNKLFNSLKKKYTLKESNIPFVGDRYAIFESGDVIIRLERPHLGNKNSVVYATKYFWNLFTSTEKQKEKAKQKAMEDNL